MADVRHVPTLRGDHHNWASPQQQEAQIPDQIQEQQLVSKVQWELQFVSTKKTHWNLYKLYKYDDFEYISGFNFANQCLSYQMIIRWLNNNDALLKSRASTVIIEMLDRNVLCNRAAVLLLND